MRGDGGFAIENNLAAAVRDLHQFGSVGSKMIGARENDAQGFLRPLGKQDRVGNHFSLKIDVGFGDGSDMGELHPLWNRVFGILWQGETQGGGAFLPMGL